MPKAGRYRHQIAVQANSPSADASGGLPDSWSTSATVWGSWITGSGGETEAGARVEGRNVEKFRTRYPSITNKNRVTWNSRTFDVLHVSDPGELHREYIVTCEEVL